MGVDDANEGRAAGECVEHLWATRGVTFDLDGSHIDEQCTRCGALRMYAA